MRHTHSKRVRRFRHDIRQFRRQAWYFTLALLMLLFAHSALSNHASIKATVKPVLAKILPKSSVVVTNPVPEPSTATLLLLGGATLLWRRRRDRQASKPVENGC
jgi:hypothetical protein